MSIDEQPMNVYWSGQKSPTSNKYKINYKGTVATASNLPTTGNKKGDTYNISEDGSDYIWTGTEWDKFGANVYIGATSTANGVQGLVPPASNSQIYSLLTGGGTWESAEDLGLALNDEVIHKTGSEEISGVKTFTNEAIAIKNLNHDSSQTLSERKFYNLDFLDSNNVNVGRIRYRFETNGSVSVFMQAKKQGGNLDSYFDIRITDFPRINAAGNVFAYPSNTYSLGESDCLWSVVYAATGSINTSDERMKSSIGDISDIVLDAWENVSWMQYKFNDAVKKKGNNARVHVGLVAQRVKNVFEANGIDPSQFGFFCHDEWEAEEEERDEDGNLLREAKPAGDAYAMRYEEALCIEAAYQRRRADRLEARIKVLEEKLK